MPYCPECSVSVPDDVQECPTCGASLELTKATPIEEPQPPPLDLDRLQATLSTSLAPTYEVLKPLGQGGMGAIFLAKEPALKRLVAVKILAPKLAKDRSARVRFEREARAAAAISHPNVVRVYAVGETKRTKLPYIIMQYVDGPNLEDWWLRRRKLSERDVRRVIGEVAAALAAAHERDLAHRDVKPSNVLLESKTGRAYVADFGVSAALSGLDDETKLTSTGAIIGTPTYMSPEQSEGKPVTPASDVYSLGVVAYQVLTGSLPFKANSTVGWVAAHLRDTPTPTAERRPEISPALAQMIDRCLAKSPDVRPTADEIARGLLPSLETEIEWPPPGLKWLAGRALNLSRLATIAAAGAGVVTAAWSFVPDALVANAGWLARFQLASDITGSAEQLDNRVSNAAVLAKFLWQVAITVGLVAYGAAGLTFLGSAFRTLGRIIRQRSLGWRLATLLDLAADHDGRSGLVIAGTGDFASFPESRRRGILRARKGANALIVAGASWVIAAFALRVLLLVVGMTGPVAANTIFTPFDTGIILAPGGLLALFGLAFRLWERQMLGKLGRTHSFDAEPGDVSRWYESLRSDQAQPAACLTWRQDRVAVWTARVARIALILIVPVVALILAFGAVATLSAGGFSGRFGAEAAQLLATLDEIDRTDPIGTARLVWAPYLPERSSIQVNTATEWLRELRSNVTNDNGLPPYDASVAPLLSDHAEQTTGFTRAFERAVRGTIPPDTLRLLNAIADHPRTTLLRRLAAAPNVDVWDATRASTTEDSLSLERVGSIGPAVTEAVRANALAALFDASQGNLDAAQQRLGENAAIGEHLLRAPVVVANRLAMSLLSNQALLPLSSLERTRGRMEQAAQIERAAAQILLGHRFGNAAGLAANPNDLDQLLAALGSETVPPGIRVQWLGQAWGGLCAHPREILLGPTEERRVVMRAIADSITLIPHIQEDAGYFESWWRWPFTTSTIGEIHSAREAWFVDKFLLAAPFRMLDCASPGSRPF